MKARTGWLCGLRRLALSVALFSALALFIGSGCLSPTLPLPPPEAPSVMHPADVGEGYWTITGDCDPGALVTVFNERTGEGAVVEDREKLGRYTVVIRATPCDVAWVKQEIGEDSSARTSFVVQERSASGPADPGACH